MEFFFFRTDFFKQMYGLVLEQGGTSGTYEQSVEVLRNTYIMAGKDFPFVVIPERYTTSSMCEQKSYSQINNNNLKAITADPINNHLYFTYSWGMMPQGIAFHNSDPRPDYFDPIIRRLQDFGLMDFFFRKHMPPRGIKDATEEAEEPLVIEHFYLPLMFWAVSLMVALALFGFEKIFPKKIIIEHIL